MVRLENLLKTSLQDVLKMSWRHLEDVFKTSWRRLEDIWPRWIYWSWPRRLEDALKRSWRRLENVLKTFWRHMAKTNILVLNKTSWRRLEDIFWTRKAKLNIFVLIKTSWRRLQKTKTKNVFKTSWSRRMFAGSLSLKVHTLSINPKTFENILAFCRAHFLFEGTTSFHNNKKIN